MVSYQILGIIIIYIYLHLPLFDVLFRIKNVYKSGKIKFYLIIEQNASYSMAFILLHCLYGVTYICLNIYI